MEKIDGSKKAITRCNKILIVAGIILIFSAIGSYFFSQVLIKQKIHDNVIIQTNSSAYKFWQNPPAKILRKYYLFDVRNPIEVQSGKDKPYLVQRGPYVYSEVWQKRHVEFLGYELLRFTPVITLHYEPTLSNGTEDDLITFLNIPAMGMIETAIKGKSKELEPLAVDFVLKAFNTKLFETKTAGELINGYKDPLMTLAKIFLPKVIKDDKFSLINGKNGTEYQNYTIMTGHDYASNVARVVSWDGLERLDFWESESANLINGTDGTFYPPFRTKDQHLYAYNADMCRSYDLVFLKENNVLDMDVYDFHLRPDIFYNESVNPNNAGFCPGGKCLGNGVLNISKCYGGVSGFISQPHFLNADKKFVNSAYGLQPDEDKHDFILHFEPTTGVPLSGNIRLQISFYAYQHDKIDLVKNMTEMLFPVVWFDEYLELDQDTRNQLKTVATIVKLTNAIPIAMISSGSGLALLSVSIVLFRYYKIKTKRGKHDEISETSPLINPDSI